MPRGLRPWRIERMTTEAVVFVLDSGAEPYRILTWRDDMDDTGARVVR